MAELGQIVSSCNRRYSSDRKTYLGARVAGMVKARLVEVCESRSIPPSRFVEAAVIRLLDEAEAAEAK